MMVQQPGLVACLGRALHGAVLASQQSLRVGLRFFDIGAARAAWLPSVWFALIVLASSSVDAQDGEGGADDPAAVAQKLFEDSVRVAIDAGAKYLYEDVRSPQEDEQQVPYPLGKQALYAYALLESGIEAENPLIADLFRSMTKLPLRKVYSVSLAVMALDARERRRADSTESTRKKTKRAIRRCVEWLVEARMRGKGIWGYERIRRRVSGVSRGQPQIWVDYSNTQFAILAFQVALRYDIKFPDAFWEEVVRSHSDSAREKAPLTSLWVEGSGWWRDVADAPVGLLNGNTGVGEFEVVREGSELRLLARPLGWPYRPEWNRPPFARASHSYSMTCAATSSLMVARNGLAANDALPPELRRAIDEKIAGGLLTLRSDWSSLTLMGQDNLWRNYYYTLYSFEKAMDLGGIARLGEVDWYAEQARKLIGQQKPSGAWGRGPNLPAQPLYDRVSTAFALLFLNRATRYLRIEAPDPIETLADDADGVKRGVKTGRVFLPSRGGMVKLADLFGQLARQRDDQFMKLAREVAESVPPDEVPDLLPYWLLLLHKNRDRVDSFAREQIAAVTGWDSGVDIDRERVESWQLARTRLIEWGQQRSRNHIAETVALLEKPESGLPLRLLALETLVRIGSLDAVPKFIECLADDSVEIRARAHRALQALTLSKTEFDATGDESVRAAGIARWQRYWETDGKNLQGRRDWDRLRLKLEAATDPETRSRIRAEIIALGPWILPEVERILAGDHYAFDWILIREALSGQQDGL